jgi:hypothetical protein
MSETKSTDPALANWPRDPASGRYLCTLARPMPPGAPGAWAHQDTARAGTCSEGCCDRYECRACGKLWTQEVAQCMISAVLHAANWAKRHGRLNDATMIEAYLQGWNARCKVMPDLPSPETVADHLRSMLIDGTTQCPLCGKTHGHKHSAEEIVIYRNGVKYGRSLTGSPAETECRQFFGHETDPCEHCGKYIGAHQKTAIDNCKCGHPDNEHMVLVLTGPCGRCDCRQFEAFPEPADDTSGLSVLSRSIPSNQQLREALADVSLWLRSALDCKQWVWDSDQRLAAMGCLATADELLNSSGETTCSGWQPIATAPKDGAHILAYFDHDPVYRSDEPSDRMAVVKWSGKFSMWTMPGISGLSPVLWKPLKRPALKTSAPQSVAAVETSETRRFAPGECNCRAEAKEAAPRACPIHGTSHLSAARSRFCVGSYGEPRIPLPYGGSYQSSGYPVIRHYAGAEKGSAIAWFMFEDEACAYAEYRNEQPPDGPFFIARDEILRLQTQNTNLLNTVAAKEAKIDALMLEYCPGEMSAEQRENWAKHQRAVEECPE